MNTESLVKAIKLVCTNPASAFIRLPPTVWSMKIKPDLIFQRELNYPIQAALSHLSFISDSFFPEVSLRKMREMTDEEQKIYDEFKELAGKHLIDLDFADLSHLETRTLRTRIRDHADNAWLWPSSPTGRAKSEPVKMHFVKRRGE